MRELDKERQKLEVQEKKLVADIKKGAQEGKLVRFQASVEHDMLPHRIDSFEIGRVQGHGKGPHQDSSIQPTFS